MKRFLLTLSFLLLALASLFAQSGKLKISGAVADSSATPLVGATVTLIHAKDSVLAGFSTTQADGGFMIGRLKKDDYILTITYIGYETFTQTLKVNKELELGTLKLEAESKLLNEVLVKGDRVPVVINGDTIEYNADAFQTQPNAVVEDLLKRLPGVEVERDGTIRAQGEQV